MQPKQSSLSCSALCLPHSPSIKPTHGTRTPPLLSLSSSTTPSLLTPGLSSGSLELLSTAEASSLVNPNHLIKPNTPNNSSNPFGDTKELKDWNKASIEREGDGTQRVGARREDKSSSTQGQRTVPSWEIERIQLIGTSPIPLDALSPGPCSGC